MGLFDKVKKTTIESRRYEEKLYEVALEEVEAGEVRKGLYAKALSKADGDKEKADGIYLKLRVQAIMDDFASEQINRRDNERAYKAFQEVYKIDRQDNEKTYKTLQEIRRIEVISSEPTLENAKKKVEGSRYAVGKTPLLDIFFVKNKQTVSTLYQTTDLQDLHNWMGKHLT